MVLHTCIHAYIHTHTHTYIHTHTLGSIATYSVKLTEYKKDILKKVIKHMDSNQPDFNFGY